MSGDKRIPNIASQDIALDSYLSTLLEQIPDNINKEGQEANTPLKGDTVSLAKKKL